MFLILVRNTRSGRVAAAYSLERERERDGPSSGTRQAVPSSRRASATRPSPAEPRTGPYLPLTDIRGAVRGVQGAEIESTREDWSLKLCFGIALVLPSRERAPVDAPVIERKMRYMVVGAVRVDELAREGRKNQTAARKQAPAKNARPDQSSRSLSARRHGHEMRGQGRGGVERLGCPRRPSPSVDRTLDAPRPPPGATAASPSFPSRSGSILDSAPSPVRSSRLYM